MPKMYIKGFGFVEVKKKPKRIPKSIKVGGKSLKVDKDLYKLFWAAEHITPRARKKIKIV